MLARRYRLSPAAFAVAALACLTSSCERVPLLAPTGSTITLTSSATALSANGATQISAQVIEAAGTPPHSGTHVSFTTTLGRLDPSEVTTDINGRATVTFYAGGANGTATITASSGGATTGSTDHAVRIAIGTAAVGRVVLFANPSTVSALGGSTVVTANVVDVNGNPLSATPVTFSATAGSLSAQIVSTNGDGIASTTLTTGLQSVVTASVGAQPITSGSGTTGSTTTTTSTQTSASITIGIAVGPSIAITVPSASITKGLPATFTFTITPAPAAQNGSPIRSVTVNWGDGRIDSLGAPTGAQTATHTYFSDGSFTVTATVTDASGFVSSVSAPIFVLPQARPTVSVTANPSAVTLNSTTSTSAQVTFIITIGNPANGILDATIDYGDGIRETFSTTTTVTKAHTYTNAIVGTATNLTVIVTVIDRNEGGTTSATTTVVVNH